MPTLLSLPPDVVHIIFTHCSAYDALKVEKTSRDFRYNEGIIRAWPTMFRNLRIVVPEVADLNARLQAQHILVELSLKDALVGYGQNNLKAKNDCSPTDAAFTLEPPEKALCAILIPQSSLRYGDKGKDVSFLNEALSKLGFMQLRADDDSEQFSTWTRDALLTFQFRHIHTFERRMCDTLGIYGPETAAALAHELALWEAGRRNNACAGLEARERTEARCAAAQNVRYPRGSNMAKVQHIKAAATDSSEEKVDHGVDANLHRARIIVLGGRRAGASSLIKAFLGKPFNRIDAAAEDAHHADVAVYGSSASLCGVPVHLRLTEKRATARRTPFSSKLFAGSDAAVLVCFNVRDSTSLEQDAVACLAEVYSLSASRQVSNSLPIILVGCQADNFRRHGKKIETGEGSAAAATATATQISPPPRAVSFDKAAAFAAARGIAYVETSAFRDEVEAPFLLAALAIARNNSWLPLGKAANVRHHVRTAAMKLREAEHY